MAESQHKHRRNTLNMEVKGIGHDSTITEWALARCEHKDNKHFSARL